MRIVMFYHSLLSDWNHGNAHFLRGIVSELLARGHDVRVYEPENGWSLANMRAEYGDAPIQDFRAVYPGLESIFYRLESLDLDQVLDGADLVLVHEWNDHELVRRIGQHHARINQPYRLLFHDTHHRAITDPAGIAAYDLSQYDGVLAFGGVIRDLYLQNGWAAHAWTWHEAADTRVFYPRVGKIRLTPNPSPFTERGDLAASDSPSLLAERGAGGEANDLIWIGNWGDDERIAELHEFLIEPVRALGLNARVYGVRYPDQARTALAQAGIEYGGWLPNFRVPEVFAQYRVTVHVPRRPYVAALPGIPTIRPFEAMACGIPLISAPWQDAENLFTPGEDYLVARDGAEMRRCLHDVLNDPALAQSLSEHGLATIRARHTCAHRVDELLAIYESLTTPETELHL